MKKIKSITILLLSIVILTMSDLNVRANEKEIDTEIEYLSNGDYIKIITSQEDNSDVIMFSTSKTVSGKKVLQYTSKSGNILWVLTVHGTYAYTKETAKCTSAKVTTSIKNEHWMISSSTASKTGNSAIATAVAKRKNNGKVVETISKSVTLKCNASGKLY